jgi:hypothetical protein
MAISVLAVVLLDHVRSELLIDRAAEPVHVSPCPAPWPPEVD